MSIVSAIHDFYENHPRRNKPPTGWPTGSRLGTCTAQLQLLRVPDISKPEKLKGRAIRVFENGDRIEQWLDERLEQVYPGLVGLKQEPFFFSVALTDAEFDQLRNRIESRAVWGRVMDSFNQPRLATGEDGRVKLRLVPRKEDGRPVNYGFVLDADRQSVWVPSFIDFAVNHETLGLSIVECKSMSNYAFRRAVIGDLDYGKRCQLISYARATQANIVFVAYRSETAHLAEIAYLRGAERTRVVLTKPNGGQEVFWVDPKTERTPLVPEAGGEAQGFPADLLWETAEVQTPYDTALEAVIDERVRRVLLSDGPTTRDLALPSGSYRILDGIDREYGPPSFTCADCEGSGQQKYRKGSTIPLKAEKPCDACGQTGLLREVELPSFPCGYSVGLDTPVLCSDFSWKRAVDLVPGDMLLSVTEAKENARSHSVCVATVQAALIRPARTVMIETTDGTVVASPEHPWLVRSGGRIEWRETARIRPGNWMQKLAEPSEAAVIEDEDYRLGYIQGLVDGDGYMRRETWPAFRVKMADMEALDRLERNLRAFGFRPHRGPAVSSSKGHRPLEKVYLTSHDEVESAFELMEARPNSRQFYLGYISGFYDAEGEHGTGGTRMSQNLGPVLDRALSTLDALKIPVLPLFRQSKSNCFILGVKSGAPGLLRFFSAIRPAITRKAAMVGRPVQGGWVRVVRVIPNGEHSTVDIQTTSRTFIAGGFVSHNCPVVASCYPFARLEIDERPHYRVTREDWERAGITFTTPEGAR